jgi:hypothetical protein
LAKQNAHVTLAETWRDGQILKKDSWFPIFWQEGSVEGSEPPFGIIRNLFPPGNERVHFPLPVNRF